MTKPRPKTFGQTARPASNGREVRRFRGTALTNQISESGQELDDLAERLRKDPALDATDIPSVAKRGIGAAVDIALYLLIAMAVAIVEFYSGGFTGPKVFGTKLFDTPTPGDFGPSNWLIAGVIYLIWSLRTFSAGTTPGHGPLQLMFVNNRGDKASFVQILIRQLIRFGVLFAIPVWLFNRNQIVFLVLFAATGALIRWMPKRRAPWDLLAGTTVTESFVDEEAIELDRPLRADDLQVSGARKSQNMRARRLLNLAGWGAILVSLLIVWVLFSETWEFVTAEDFSWGLLNLDGKGKGWFPRRDRYDLATLFVGTLWVTGIAMAVAAPIGLGVAIYLSEYARPKVQRIVKPVIESLASVPSVVIGMFAIFFVSPSVLRWFFDDIGIFSIIAAGIGVGILTIPLVASISEDALRSVPVELREAAYGLGARRITVALRVVFPAALSGISAALIVGISRAIGETMVVAIAAGGSGGSLFEVDPREPGQTITAAMASLGVGTDQVAGSGIAFQSLYFLGALLFIMTLLLNVVSDAFVRRFREVY